jgi:flagellar biosynthesis protein FlhF
MRLKTFKAPTMKEALRIIKHDLGQDAVVLNTRKVKTPSGETTLEITAAIDKIQAPVTLRPADIDTQPNTPGGKGDLADILKSHGLPADHIIPLLKATAGVSDAGFSAADALEMVLGKKINFQPPATLIRRGQAHVFIGPTGAGKTTLLCKLAVERKKSGATLGLLSLDDQKVGGFDPLATVAEVLGEQAHLIQDKNDLATAGANLGKRNYLFIDTPGLNLLRPHEADQLKQRLDALGLPLVVHLVLPANLNGTDLAAMPYAFRDFAPLSALFTKLDETAQFGAVVNVALDAPLAVGLASTSPRLEDPPLLLDPVVFANRLLTVPQHIWEQHT